MSTRIPVTIDGNLTADPEVGRAENGTDWTRLRVAVNDRRLNEQTQEWEDAGVVFHDVVAFGSQARHAASSLRKGDAIIAAGEMQFSTYVDKQGQEREGRQVLANTVGASLRYNDVEVNRNPKARGPEAYATGQSATPVADSGAALTR